MHTSKDKYNQLKDKMRSAGLRLTGQRLAIARHLTERAGRHLSAKDIWRALKRSGSNTSQATVYNVLNDFAGRGIINQVDGRNYSRLYDLNTDDHDHAVDVISGEVFDIKKISQQSGLQIVEGYKIRQVVVFVEPE